MKKGKRRSKRNGVKDYISKTLCFLIILLAITISTAFVAIGPVSDLVHRIEERMPMAVRDISLDDSTYQPLTLDSAEGLSFGYGDKLAVITSDDFSLNCPVYYGSNIVSMGSGLGLSGDYGLIGTGSVSVVCGYERTYLSGLKYAEIGDIVTVTTNYGEFRYMIYDISYIDNDKDVCSDLQGDALVIKGRTSDFSEYSSEILYAFAKALDGEVG